MDMEESKSHPRTRNWTRIVDEPLSAEGFFVAFVFFVVLSQFLLYIGPETISQPLRPLIVIILTVQVVRRGRLSLSVCNFALAMSIYQLLVWFFLFPNGGLLRNYLVLVFYFMMLFSVAGFPWNRRELGMILYAAFLATFICAVVFALSNNMADFADHSMYFMGVEVNRNKNAYAFAFGIVLGRSFLQYGKGRNRIIILLMMLFEGYCLLYSKCRGAFLGVVISVWTVVINRTIRLKRRNNPYIALYLLVFLAICVIGYFVIKYSALSRLVDSEHYSGRDDGIKHAIDLFWQAPLLGKIFGNGMLYEPENTLGIGVHFVYLTYLLEAGIIGAALIGAIFLSAMKNMRGEIQWSLFMIAFSRTFFEGMDYYIFIPLILSICISNYERLYIRPARELFYRRNV